MTTATTTETRWCGWWRPRPGVRWSRLAEGVDHDDALTKLLGALASVKGGDLRVCPANVDPNGQARPNVSGGRRMF